MYMYLLIYIHILINTYNYMHLCKLVSVFSPNSLIFSLGCCARLPGLVSQLVSQSPSLFFSLGCCVRLPGLVSGLVSHLVSQSASLFFSLGCCVRLPGLVFVLSPNLSPSLPACSSAWDAVSGSLVLSPNLSPSLPACSSAWDAVSGSLVLSLSCFRSCLSTCLPVCQLVLQPGMLCPAPWSCVCLVSQSPSLFFSLGCCVRLPGLVFVLSPNLSPSLPACSSAWDAVSGSLVLCQVLSPILSSSWCLWSGLVSRIFCAICATVWGLRWCNFLTGDELESESKVAPLTLLGMPLGYSLFLDCSSEGITQSQNKFHESRQQTSRCYPKGPLRDTNMKDRCY